MYKYPKNYQTGSGTRLPSPRGSLEAQVLLEQRAPRKQGTGEGPLGGQGTLIPNKAYLRK